MEGENRYSVIDMDVDTDGAKYKSDKSFASLPTALNDLAISQQNSSFF